MRTVFCAAPCCPLCAGGRSDVCSGSYGSWALLCSQAALCLVEEEDDDDDGTGGGALGEIRVELNDVADLTSL